MNATRSSGEFIEPASSFEAEARVGILNTSIQTHEDAIARMQGEKRNLELWLEDEQAHTLHRNPVAVQGGQHTQADTPVAELVRSNRAKNMLGREGVGWRTFGQLPVTREEIAFQVQQLIERSGDVVLRMSKQTRRSALQEQYLRRLEGFVTADPETIVAELEEGLSARELSFQKPIIQSDPQTSVAEANATEQQLVA